MQEGEINCFETVNSLYALNSNKCAYRLQLSKDREDFKKNNKDIKLAVIQ